MRQKRQRADGLARGDGVRPEAARALRDLSIVEAAVDRNAQRFEQARHVHRRVRGHPGAERGLRRGLDRFPSIVGLEHNGRRNRADADRVQMPKAADDTGSLDGFDRRPT